MCPFSILWWQPSQWWTQTRTSCWLTHTKSSSSRSAAQWPTPFLALHSIQLHVPEQVIPYQHLSVYRRSTRSTCRTWTLCWGTTMVEALCIHYAEFTPVRKRKEVLRAGCMKWNKKGTMSCFNTTFLFLRDLSLISYLYLLSLSDLTNTAILIDGWKVYLLYKPTSPPITDWWLALCDTSLFLLFLYDSFQTVRGDCEGC